MAKRSVEKAVLHSTVIHEKKQFNHIVAVFPNMGALKAYAAILKLTHASGDKDGVLKLDPSARLDTEGKLIPGVKLSASTVPYSPDLAMDDDVEGAPKSE